MLYDEFLRVLSSGCVFFLGVVASRCFMRYSRRRPPLRQAPVKTMIVLGSGGHTTEMLKLVAGLDASRYTPRVYLLADTDVMSEKKLVALEQSKRTGQYTLERLPRSREVGQSYLSSVFSTLAAVPRSFRLIASHTPELLLTNGPGTCVPVLYAAWLARILWLNCRFVFMESVCRVRTLSLSAKLVRFIVDDFLVQWPHLTRKGGTFIGRLF